MKQADWIAGAIVILVGAPLAFVLVRATTSTLEQRARCEAPLKWALGPDYEAVQSGQEIGRHYLGDDLLAPDFTVRDRSGKPWRLEDHKGKLVVLNFWTLTCKPCVEEMPALEELAQLMQGRDDVEVAALSIDDGWHEVAPIFPPSPRLSVLFDPENEIVRGKFGTRLFPETWIIDPEGVIRLRVDGPLDWSKPIVRDLVQCYL